jgi:hypothetical protein
MSILTTMRRCERCDLVKTDGEFHRRRSTRQTWCKSCRKEYDAAYWRRTPQRRLRQRKLHRRALVDWSRSLNSGHARIDCGGTFHHAAMQWDHLPGTSQRREVSNMVLRGFRRETDSRGDREVRVGLCQLPCCADVRTRVGV